MATLVLSTVGQALGGPIGGAIGGLIGQGIDRQLFGPGPRSGPRLGDLSVQTSTYGAQVPRIYGRMRVAGTVIWATDLRESATPQSGAKGQPDVVTYSYSVSMAVALSSRRVQRIRRIWADGKLLRGEAGDFKVRTGFRFYPGSEDQPIDPLIASVEGLQRTPAYRGLALAVFEDFELAEYGNRIPFLTFEIEADEGPLSLADVLRDASGGAIACDSGRTLSGYAAHGANVRSAVQPLVDLLGVRLFDNGSVLRSPAPATATEVAEEELGCGAGSDRSMRIERTQTPARALPAELTINYYDPARDYQAGRMRASIGGNGGVQETAELPAAMEANSAKALAEESLAMRWTQRERLTLRLPPSHLAIEPGKLLEVPGSIRPWLVERVTLDRLVVVAELRRSGTDVGPLTADPGRPVPAPDSVAVPTSLALLDLPDLGFSRHDVPVVNLAACNGGGSWRAVPIEIDAGGEIRSGLSAFGEAVIGRTVTALGQGQSALLDLSSRLEVELVDPEHWLESRDDAALVNGANLAAVGSELIQFGSAIPMGGRSFRLSRLLRGRRGTEWAMSTHSPGEPFVLLDPNGLRAIELRRELIGSSIEVTALGIGDGPGTLLSAFAGGEAMRPPSPVHLRALVEDGGGLRISWVRRSRNGWAWVDEMDASLGERIERYRVRVERGGSQIEVEASAPVAHLSAAQLAEIGPGPVAIHVVQIGDHALSRPAMMEMEIFE